MSKSLVIVESPAKAKTINKYLGQGYIVKSSIGHVRDLPVSGQGQKTLDTAARAKEAAKTRKMAVDEKIRHKEKKSHTALIERMGIDPENDWRARYEILPGKEKVIAELKKLAEQADIIYLATDLDREGEAIAWHLREVIGGPAERFKRVVFNEITKTAIKSAFDRPDTLKLNRVNAQQTRRFLDRVVGYMVSPLLWSKIARGLSAGRVQSVAVRLLVEREREIRAFTPEEYWELFADTHTSKKDKIRLQVTKHAEENFRPNHQAETDRAVAALKPAEYRVIKREDKPTSSRPSPPFITSTLQQAASTRLGFGVKKTMTLAQRLYENGYITYMRTDSTNISADALQMCRDYIVEQWGDAYLPKQPNIYSSKQGAQEAHEAIRPTDITRLAQHQTELEKDAQKLYELIWRRFTASQMPPAEFLSTQIIVAASDFELKARGRVLRFDGYLKVQPLAKESEDEQPLPDIKTGEILLLDRLEPKQHFTKPTARYTEASLVKELEKQGIGRPSTYAAIISTIQERGYGQLKNRRFYAEKIGEIVTDRLNESFNHLMDYHFTADMEKQLDEISEGHVDWKKVLNDFYIDFRQRLQQAEKPDGMQANTPVEIDMACPTCQRPMQIRIASTGIFLGCSGYALSPKERCKTTINLIPGIEAETQLTDDDEAEINELRGKKRCPKCSTAMERYLVDEKRQLHICGNSPDCAGYILESGQFKLKGYDGPVITCDKCGSEMQLKNGRFGKYFGCTASDCSNTRKLLRSGEAAPPKSDPIPMPHLRCEKMEDYYLLREGAAGIFLAASQFPKHRETRAPLVEELQNIRDQLPEKLKYLADAPVQDSQGNKAIVRFSRKTKQQYVTSEMNNKATKWAAFYKNGRWSVTE